VATNSNALHWPALDLRGEPLPARLTCARARKSLDEELPLGSADVPQSTTFWRTLGDTCYAVAVHPGAASDLLEWKRPAEVPAVLGALLLLPAAAATQWSSEDEIDVAGIDKVIDEGLRALAASSCSEEALTDFYAALLAGGRAVSLRGLSAPLLPAAMAALLLPLPRDLADRISVAGWLPSSRLSDAEAQQMRRCWDAVLGETVILHADAPQPTSDQLSQARIMARSIFAGSASNQQRASFQPGKKPIELTLWGPTAVGKTVLLAQLYLESSEEGQPNSDWEVFLAGNSVTFFQNMRATMQTSNLFPTATSGAQIESIEYVFKHKNGARSFLHLEDRPGRESETLEERSDGQISLKQRLGSADGLILLFDPISDERLLEARVWRTLELVYDASGRMGDKDARPIAVCVSKADVLIDTPADFRRALDRPDEFVRERVSRVLVRALDRYCDNYRLFPISAVGIRLQHGVIEPAMFIDEGLQPRICPGSRPFNLMAPFTWLLNQLAEVA
jgi:hypothetical protein